MPRRTSSSHRPQGWSSMDFGSEDEQEVNAKSPQPTRVYVDPWDLENYAFMRRHLFAEEEQPDSYYDYNDLARSPKLPQQDFVYGCSPQRTLPSADSPTLFAGIDELDFRNDNFEAPYGEDEVDGDGGDELRDSYLAYSDPPSMPLRVKRLVPRPSLLINTDTGSSLSSNNENYVYSTDPTSPDASLIYVYETTSRKRKIAKSARRISSTQRRPLIGKYRRIRNIDCMECSLLESAGFFDGYDPDLHMARMEYEVSTIRPPPENFGLSSYGHLKIDYSCSWHSLDRLIKSSER